MPAGQRVAALGVPGDLRCDAQADVATAQAEAAIQRAFAGEEEERLKASEIVR